jgi:ribosomal protein L7/L12
MPIRLINTEKYLTANDAINSDRGAFSDWVVINHPKIAIAYDEWLAGETVRKEEEQRENERKRQEAIENEKRRLAAEKNWAIRLIDVNNKLIESGKKINTIKMCCQVFGYGLAEAKDWSEMKCDIHTTEAKAKDFALKFGNEFPLLNGLLNIWQFKH